MFDYIDEEDRETQAYVQTVQEMLLNVTQRLDVALNAPSGKGFNLKRCMKLLAVITCFLLGPSTVGQLEPSI
jgi:hypothetical protein